MTVPGFMETLESTADFLFSVCLQSSAGYRCLDEIVLTFVPHIQVPGKLNFILGHAFSFEQLQCAVFHLPVDSVRFSDIYFIHRPGICLRVRMDRSEEHTSELQ